ncbi:MAG: hypothetical protein FWG34_00890 [Oscillospiraceae bacterium]|nr:hypothetical protein [Oscillospiraceae bacterium]
MEKLFRILGFALVFCVVSALFSCEAKKGDPEEGAADEIGESAAETTGPPTETNPPPTTDPGPKKKSRDIAFADTSDESERHAVKVGEGGGYKSIGVKFTAEFTITDIDLSCPSWSDDIGTMVFRLYKWDTDYATTVAGTPVLVDEETLVDYPDNAMMSLDFGIEIEPGTYLWELSEGKDGVGMWSFKTPGEDGLEFFRNGEKVSDEAYNGTLYGFVME